MAVVMVQDVEGGSQALYDQINEHLHAREDPPAGLIMHTAGPTETGWRVVDIWESAEALTRFRDERLMPAIKAAVDSMPSQPRVQINEVYDLLQP
jgi:quinol monooxygenase YgiN